MKTPRPAALAALLLALLVCASACATTVRRTPEFAPSRVLGKTVALAPPIVFAARRLTGDKLEPLAEQSARIELELPGAFAAALWKSGFHVSPIALPARAAALDEPLAAATQIVQVEFQQIQQRLYRREELPEKKAFGLSESLGPAAAHLAGHAQADLLALASVWSYEKSGGRIAADLGLSFLVAAITLGHIVLLHEFSGSVLTVALADGASGKILWSNRLRTGDDPEELTPERLEKLAGRLLEGLGGEG